MFTGRRHPNDDALVRRYMADRGLDALQPKDEAVVQHVEACPSCAARYAAVCRDLDETAREARTAADEAFPAERLVAQRERILRRLESQGARVIAFPGRDADARAGRPARPLLRWVAVAAAAGLLIGVTLGTILNPGRRDAAQTPASVVATRPAPAGAGAYARPVSLAAAQDDGFLSEIEVALSSRSVPELEAIDALTLETADLPIPATRKE